MRGFLLLLFGAKGPLHADHHGGGALLVAKKKEKRGICSQRVTADRNGPFFCFLEPRMRLRTRQRLPLRGNGAMYVYV